MTKPAEQDGEYLHHAHVIITAALAEVTDPDTATEDWATWVLDHLAAAGWHLINADDAERMLAAYVMGQAR